MNVKLICPVCDRPDIEDDICVNCETNLSTFHILAKLPIVEVKNTLNSTIKIWLLSSVFTVFVIGVSLGVAGGSLLLKQPLQPTAISIPGSIATSVSAKSVISKPLEPCTREFYYTVRQGDSLTKIARQFYGDRQKSQLILRHNPQLKGREKDIDLDEKLLIPKLYRTCE
jgi:hypothetical protein